MGELGARAMVAHDLGGDWHNADTLADLNAKISDGTLVIQTGGSYTGDGTVNRAIPHGLGVVPKIVILLHTGEEWHRIYGGYANILYNIDGMDSGLIAVTAPDATNFYVGNAADYLKSANSNGAAYRWAAIG